MRAILTQSGVIVSIYDSVRGSLERMVNCVKYPLAITLASVGISCAAPNFSINSYNNANLQQLEKPNKKEKAQDINSFTAILESKRTASGKDDKKFLDDIWDNTDYGLLEPNHENFTQTVYFLLEKHYPNFGKENRIDYEKVVIALVFDDRDKDGLISAGDYVAFIEPSEWKGKHKWISGFEVKLAPEVKQLRRYTVPPDKSTVMQAYNPVVSLNGDARDFFEFGGGVVLPQEENNKIDDKHGALWSGAGRISLGKGISVKADAFGEKDEDLSLSNYLVDARSARLFNWTNLGLTGYSGKISQQEEETVRINEPDARTRGTIDRQTERKLTSLTGDIGLDRFAATFMISNYKDITDESHNLVVTPLDPATGQPIGNPIPVTVRSDVALSQTTGFLQMRYMTLDKVAIGSDVSYASADTKIETEVNGAPSKFDDKLTGQGIEPFGVYAGDLSYAYLGIPLAQVAGERIDAGVNVDTAFLGRDAVQKEDAVIIGANFKYLGNSLRTTINFHYTLAPIGALERFLDFRRLDLLLDKTGNEAYLPEMFEQLERNNFLNSLIINNAFGGRFTLDSPEDTREKALRGLIGVPVPYYSNALLFAGASKVFHREALPIKDAVQAGANVRILSTPVADIYAGALYGYTNIANKPDKSEAQMWLGVRF